MSSLLSEDLEAVREIVAPHWTQLQHARLFITGGTGFIGSWLLETLLDANDALGLNVRATVLTRNQDAFRKKAPHLAEHRAIALLEGDVRTFRDPSTAPYDFVIHGAAESSTRLNEERPDEMIASVVDGTRRMLAFASERGARRLLFLSSGAVYGAQPANVDRMAEDFRGGPDLSTPRSAYAEAKRVAEVLCQCASMETMIARCFAFIGPYLPIDVHFAAGNFIRDALEGSDIRINGDGTTLRTYLYAADLAAWLWTILLRGTPSAAYNVGSEREVSILELAQAIAAQCDTPPAIHMAKTPIEGASPARYTPSTARAREELGLAETVPLDLAVRKTLRWHRARREAAARA